MAKKRGKAAKERVLTERQIARLHELEGEEAARSISWFRHDSDAHSDPAVALLMAEPDGLALYGLYWLLIEHLAARDGHRYEVASTAGWHVLMRDLALWPQSEEDMALAERFIGILARLELIEPELYKQGVIGSRRLWQNCAEVGKGRAAKRLAGEITAEERWRKKDERT